jgi:hypothetical protein
MWHTGYFHDLPRASARHAGPPPFLTTLSSTVGVHARLDPDAIIRRDGRKNKSQLPRTQTSNLSHRLDRSSFVVVGTGDRGTGHQGRDYVTWHVFACRVW